MSIFKAQLPSRQKEVVLYLSRLKSEEAKERNMLKVIAELKEKRK